MNQWRLLITPQMRGAINMALDSAITDSVAKGLSPPTIRFYDWNPHCLSFGYNQNISTIEYSNCKEFGIDMVRRPTGGRAVLHAQEFTYSVIIPACNALFNKSIMETYKLLSNWLVEGLRTFGIDAQQSTKRRRKSLKQPYEKFCFALPHIHEIMVDNKKLIGSAQRRWPDVVLQHGSILVGQKHLKSAKLLNENQSSQRIMERYLQQNTTYLEEYLSDVPGIYDFAVMMSQTWAKMFQANVKMGDLSEDEKVASNSVRSKYSLLEIDNISSYKNQSYPVTSGVS